MNHRDLASSVLDHINTLCRSSSATQTPSSTVTPHVSIPQKEGENTDILDDVETEDCCPICHGLLFRPVRPMCTHTFCRFCLILWVEKCNKDNQEGMCPMCRSEVILPETLEIDDDLEKTILQKYGSNVYQSRHKDMVKEKIERLVTDLEVEHLKEIEESCSMQDLARAGILGTAFAGPIGAVTALGLMGVYAAYTSVMRLKREDRRKFGIIEDDAWSDIPYDSIRLTNISLTRVSIEMYASDAIFAQETRTLEPGETGLFFPSLEEDEGSKNHSFCFRVILPGLLDKELASMPVCLNHGYLFCCTDVCVEEVGPMTIYSPTESQYSRSSSHSSTSKKSACSYRRKNSRQLALESDSGQYHPTTDKIKAHEMDNEHDQITRSTIGDSDNRIGTPDCNPENILARRRSLRNSESYSPVRNRSNQIIPPRNNSSFIPKDSREYSQSKSHPSTDSNDDNDQSIQDSWNFNSNRKISKYQIEEELNKQFDETVIETKRLQYYLRKKREAEEQIAQIALDAREVHTEAEEEYRSTSSNEREPLKLEITNDSLHEVKCSFYSGTNYFADDTINLRPKRSVLVNLPYGVNVTTVQVCIVQESFFTPDTDLCSVQMKAGYRYQILQSRIFGNEPEQENPETTEENIFYTMF